MKNHADSSMPDQYNSRRSVLSYYMAPHGANMSRQRFSDRISSPDVIIQEPQEHSQEYNRHFYRHQYRHSQEPHYNQPQFQSPRADDLEQISASAFHNAGALSSPSLSSPSWGSDSRFVSARQAQNSIQSYRSVNRTTKPAHLTPPAQSTNGYSQMMRIETHPKFNKNGSYESDHAQRTHSLNRIRHSSTVVIPPFQSSTIGYDTSSHNRWIVVDNPDLNYINDLQNSVRERHDTEDAKLYRNGNTYLLFILLMNSEFDEQFHFIFRRYKTCSEIYVRDPSKIYIRAVLKGKHKNRFKYKPDDVFKLFEPFNGIKKISNEGECYVLSVEEYALNGIKHRYGSTVRNGRLYLEISLETELMTLLPIDETSSSSDEDTDSKTINRITYGSRKRRTTSSILNNPRVGKKQVGSHKGPLHDSRNVHIVSSDEEEDYRISNLSTSAEARRIGDISGKKASQVSSAELLDAMSDEENEDLKSILNNKQLEEGAEDEDIIMSNSPILSSNSPHSKKGLESVAVSQVISDADKDHIISINEKDYDNARAGNIEFSRDGDDDGEEKDLSGTSSKNAVELSDDDYDFTDGAKELDYGHFESFPKNHIFHASDAISKFLIVRMIPESYTKFARFIDDVLVRMTFLKAYIIDIHVNSEARESLIEFQKKEDVIVAIKNLHGFKYSGNILTTVMSDNEYAKSLYVFCVQVLSFYFY